MPALVYAIDFGTSNSLLAAADPERLHEPLALDPDAADPTVMKSLLYTPSDGAWFFGAKAIEEYSEHGAEGRFFRSLKKYLPDPAFSGTTVHKRYYNLTELIAVILRAMRERANAAFDEDVTSVVLGRPARFAFDEEGDKLATARLEAAAKLAGFKEVSFCPEPVAAAYEFRHQLSEPRTVLIADFGGGTSDFSVLELGRERFTDRDVLAIGGVSIAGDRFDGALMKHAVASHFGTNVTYKLPMGSNELRLPQHLINKLCSPADVSFLSRRDMMTLLKDAQRWSLRPGDAERMNRLFVLIEEHLGYKLFKSIEATKIALSDASEACFSFAHPGIEVEEQVLRADFTTYTSELVESITKELDETLHKAQVAADEVDIVCCTGGTAKIPALSHALERRFGKEKLRQHRHFHSVVGGLAERAQALLTS